VASLFDHLCGVNAVSHNPVRGVKRPKAELDQVLLSSDLFELLVEAERRELAAERHEIHDVLEYEYFRPQRPRQIAVNLRQASASCPRAR
jgi:hypothetical protein